MGIPLAELEQQPRVSCPKIMRSKPATIRGLYLVQPQPLKAPSHYGFLLIIAQMASSPFQQESAEIPPGALGLGVADDDELLSPIALGFAPETPVAGHIRRADSLRHDPFSLGLARGVEETLAVTDMVVAVTNGQRRVIEEFFQGAPSVRGAGVLLGLCRRNEVDRKRHRQDWWCGGCRCGLKCGKRRSAVRGKRTEFAVEIGGCRGQRR